MCGIAAFLFFYPFVESLLKNIYSGDGIQQMVSASLILLAVVYGLAVIFLILPQLIGGLLFLAGKSSSKVWGIIAVSFALITIPVGTLIGIYGLWFLLSEKGKQYFNNRL